MSARSSQSAGSKSAKVIPLKSTEQLELEAQKAQRLEREALHTRRAAQRTPLFSASQVYDGVEEELTDDSNFDIEQFTLTHSKDDINNFGLRGIDAPAEMLSALQGLFPDSTRDTGKGHIRTLLNMQKEASSIFFTHPRRSKAPGHYACLLPHYRNSPRRRHLRDETQRTPRSP